MLKDIPNGLVKYSESPEFDQNSLPLALQKEHKTKPGVWAKAMVTSGSIDYIIEAKPDETIKLNAGDFAVIEPEEPHHVVVTGPVKFHLEFYK